MDRDRSVRVHQYWDPSELGDPDTSLTLSDCADLLRNRIDAATRSVVDVGGPIGGHISGGLDCTSISCRVNQLLVETGQSLVAGYSWAPSNSDIPRFVGDERSLLDDVSTSESVDIRTITSDGSGDWFFDLDPDRYPGTAQARERFVLPQARSDGARVMVSGWGGDELASFNGRGVLRSLVRRGSVRTVWGQTNRRLELTTGSTSFKKRTRSFGATVLDAAPAWIPDPRHRSERRRQSEVDAEIDAVLRSVSPLAADTRQERLRTFQQASDHHEIQLALLTGGHLQRRCESWYQTGRLFDVSYRYPLLDLDVVIAALRLPWWAFRSEGWTRTAFRMAVEPWVPKSVAWNITKSEPALFAPRPPDVVQRKDDSVAWRAGDEEYQRVLAIAARVNALSRGDGRALQPVRSRPDAAPSAS